MGGENVVAVGLWPNRRRQSFCQLVDDSIEIERDYGQEIVPGPSDRAGDNFVRGEADPGGNQQR